MTIFLTGGSGMLGRHLLSNPEFKAFQVVAPTRQELDLFDYEGVSKYVSALKPDMIIHAAGRLGGIAANQSAHLDFLMENLMVAQNVVMAAKTAGVPKLLNLGSSCMYPRNVEALLTEDMILKGELEPTNEGYALAKIVATRMCEYISISSPGFQYKTIIPCNLYGPWDRFDLQRSHLIPAAIIKVYQATTNQQPSVEIWGDGTARREFMYTGDLADFIVQALHHFELLPLLTNVGIGQDYTVNEYYHEVAQVLGFKGSFTHNLTGPVGMKRKLLSVERATALWGWKPQTSLSEGIQKTYQFYRQTLENPHDLVSIS